MCAVRTHAFFGVKPLFQTFRQPQTFSENFLAQRPSEIQFSDGLIVYIASKANSQTRQSPVHGRWGVLGRGFLGRR